MKVSGAVEWIHIASEQGAPVEAVDTVDGVAQRGLRGDRYFRDEGIFATRDGSDVTFIEKEALTAVEREYNIELEPGSHRRNVTTSGVALNHLVDQDFRVGSVYCRGVELCEPCAYLEQHLEKEGIQNALVHRGGLRATILESGTISPGDEIETL